MAISSLPRLEISILQSKTRGLFRRFINHTRPYTFAGVLVMELFVKRAPQQVVDAMRQTVTNMIGTLPSMFFAVTVTTICIRSMPIGESENLFFIDCLIKGLLL